MKILLSLRLNWIMLLIVTIFAVDAFGQYRRNVVFWNEKAGCGSQRVVSDSVRFVCRRLLVDEQSVRVVEQGPLKLSVLPVRSPLRTILYVKIENVGGEKLQITPTEWNLAHYTSEADFLQGKRPMLNETSFEPPPAKSAAGVISPDRSDPFAMATTRTIKTVSDGREILRPTVIPEGQRQSVVVPETKRTSTIRVVTTSRNRRLKAGLFNENTLARKSVWLKDEISGTVLFNRLQASTFQLAMIHVGDTSFVFELR